MAKRTKARRSPRPAKAKRYIVRSDRAGVFFGEIVKRGDKVVEMRNSRRIWYWAGAASLSELAVKGTSKPSECKFPIAMPSQLVNNWEEIIEVSDEAAASIDAVPVWTCTVS